MFSSKDCDELGGVIPDSAASARDNYAAINDLDAVAAATPAYGSRLQRPLADPVRPAPG